MSRNKYHINLKVNSLGSKIIKVNPHEASESLVVHIILLIIIGLLTFSAHKSGEIGLTYFGLVITGIFLLIALVDIYFIISKHLTKSEKIANDENP
jgi:hypothetical protein